MQKASRNEMLFVIRLGLALGDARRRFQSEAEKEPLGESPINKERESPKDSLFVIRLGLEPKTPTLKVLCSTS